jgi:hypothetical protein
VAGRGQAVRGVAALVVRVWVVGCWWLVALWPVRVARVHRRAHRSTRSGQSQVHSRCLSFFFLSSSSRAPLTNISTSVFRNLCVTLNHDIRVVHHESTRTYAHCLLHELVLVPNRSSFDKNSNFEVDAGDEVSLLLAAATKS